MTSHWMRSTPASRARALVAEAGEVGRQDRRHDERLYDAGLGHGRALLIRSDRVCPSNRVTLEAHSPTWVEAWVIFRGMSC